MDVPYNRSKLVRISANRKAGGSPTLVQILHRLIHEHESSRVAVSIFALAVLVSVVVWGAPAAAQDEPPLIMPSEHKLPTKKDLGPRAVGILQISAQGKASLVPIAIMIDGKFWDASAYKADPVPMALESGTVYEIERTGSSEGLFTVGSALHSNAVNSQVPWLGTGDWVPAGTEKKSTVMTAKSIPVGMTDTDAPPRLTRDPTKVYPQKQAPSSPSSSSSNPSASSSKSAGTSNSDEPPRLTKPETESNASADSTASPPAQSGSTPSAPNSSGPPSPSNSGNAKTTSHENIPADDSGADAANRPVLRRGRPALSFADEEIPGYSKPGAPPSVKAKSAAAAKAQSPPEPVQLIPAVSDAHGPDPHSYGFEWLKGEEEQRRDQMLALAKQQLATYLKAEAKEEITPEEHPSHTLHRVAAKKSPEPIFESAKMVAYDLWLTNQPVLVFTAEAHLPPTSSSAQAGPYRDLTYSITIAAYPDIYNNLHKLYVGVTDKYHLDVTPKLELIDAVDADGDGRGELLFRETSDEGTGWVIYRATADSLWKMYDSLNPQ
jgi:hypothetical protein